MLEYGPGDGQVWGKVQTAGNSTSASFDNTVVGERSTTRAASSGINT